VSESLQGQIMFNLRLHIDENMIFCPEYDLTASRDWTTVLKERVGIKISNIIGAIQRAPILGGGGFQEVLPQNSSPGSNQNKNAIFVATASAAITPQVIAAILAPYYMLKIFIFGCLNFNL
jgi:hypothetical protein